MMKGWILIALAAGVIYYLVTETDRLDKPISEANTLIKKAERKLDSLTGTQIVKADKRLQHLKSLISDRLSTKELAELNNSFKTIEDIDTFKEEFCSSANRQHIIFSKENLSFICDSL